MSAQTAESATEQVDEALKAWRERLREQCRADYAETRAKPRRRRQRDAWWPISVDPDTSRAATRRQAVERAIRLRLEPCSRCGKGSPLDTDDPCRCGTEGTDWEAFVWARAALLPTVTEQEAETWTTQRSGWR